MVGIPAARSHPRFDRSLAVNGRANRRPTVDYNREDKGRQDSDQSADTHSTRSA